MGQGLFFFMVVLPFLFCASGRADVVTPPPIPSVDINNMIPLGAVSELVKIFGNLTDHRSFQGAEPMGVGHLDLGIEATLMHLPDDFSNTLSSAGFGVGSSAPPALPMPKIHLTKGISPVMDVGLSGLYYKGNYILGVGLKTLLYRPEEGVSWAVRANYSNTVLDLEKAGANSLPVKVDGVSLGTGTIAFGFRTLSLELLASRPLNYAEPYVGAGVHWVNGQVSARMKLDVLTSGQELYTPGYSFYNLNLFGGVVFRMRPLGLMIALEGAYSSLGMDYFGLVAGFGF